MRFTVTSIRWALWTLSILFAAASILYSAVWMYHVRIGPTAALGIDYEFLGPSSGILITAVRHGAAAERAGLRVGDRIIAVNGVPLKSRRPYYDAINRGTPGDQPTLAVAREGFATPLVLRPTLGAAGVEDRTPVQQLVLEIIRAYPLLWLVVALVVLFQRLHDPNAWLLALLFAAFISSAPLFESQLPPSLRAFAIAYHVTFRGLFPALFYFFFAVFPVRSPIDRQVPWLKWLAVGVGLATALPLANIAFLARGLEPLTVMARRVPAFAWMDAIYSAGFVALGLVSLLWNNLSSPTIGVRRRTRVMMLGTVVGTTPGFILTFVSLYFDQPLQSWPFSVWASAVLALLLVPLSFAYAVVKHRVLEIPVLLRRSARYLLVQRGFSLVVLLVCVIVTLQFALVFARSIRARTEVAVPVGALFGVLLAQAASRSQKHVTRRIDRAFFRSAYDARNILEDLAEKTRTATDRDGLAVLLERHLSEALHPVFLSIYLEDRGGGLIRVRGHTPGGPERIDWAEPWLQEIVRYGQPWEVPPNGEGHSESSALPAGSECLVPALSRDGRPLGLLVLGPKRSEEPYSSEDRRLLASIASQAGSALENISLAEQMAERLEADRRAAHEIEIAKEVQQKLFPQRVPPLQTLDYGGLCLQARVVGGDYYDFLDLGHGRVGLVLADISGKGIAAALLMANLQANLRSQYALALEDLPRLLSSVNHSFYESTAPNRFATLFFATYSDESRTLRYANCGHNPPLVVRAKGEVEWLAPTAPVLGLFEQWSCSVHDVKLLEGDILVIFSDGITESNNEREEEYGEARLLASVRRHSDRSATDLLRALVEDVRSFAGAEQSDDVTLVVARGVSP